MTIRFYDEGLTAFVDVPSFQFNDSRSWKRGQAGVEDISGSWMVTDRGYTQETLTGIVSGMTKDQMQLFRDFVIETLEYGKKGFLILITNNRKSGWNTHKVKVFSDAIVGGSYIAADGTYSADEYIVADYYLEGPFVLRKQELKFIEKGGPGGGIFEVSIQAVRESWE